MLRLRAYEKLQMLVQRGVVTKTEKKYKGVTAGLKKIIAEAAELKSKQSSGQTSYTVAPKTAPSTVATKAAPSTVVTKAAPLKEAKATPSKATLSKDSSVKSKPIKDAKAKLSVRKA